MNLVANILSHLPSRTLSRYEAKVTIITLITPIQTVGLASYPSSGNTWLRYLIEGVTGREDGDKIVRTTDYYY